MPRNPDGPRLQGLLWHLTYKTHLNRELWEGTFRHMLGGFKVYSFVHEVGDGDESGATTCENPTVADGYKHTHIFLWLQKPLDTTQMRYFDFGVDPDQQEVTKIHPHIKKATVKQAKTICLKYHLGYKTSKDGKKKYIEPTMLYQEGVEEWKFTAEMWEIARAAPTLEDACNAAGIEIKSMSDMKLARAEGKKRSYNEMKEDCKAEYCLPLPVEWNRKKFALLLSGKPGTGKSQWALAQFERPFVITDYDDLKDIPSGCDGLVFDDQSFAMCRKEMKLSVLCVDENRRFRTRHVSANVPPLPRIFTCNDLDFIFGNPQDPKNPMDPQTWDCIQRRLVNVNVTDFPGGKLFQLPGT